MCRLPQLQSGSQKAMTSSCHVTGYVIVATLLVTSSHGGRPTFRVDEQLPVGHVVGNMADVVTSHDAGRSFSLLAARGGDMADDKAESLFAVNSESGILQTAEIIDREQLCISRRSPSCIISLDVAILPRFDVVSVDVEVVDVNDHAPSFNANATTRHVIESATPGPVFLLPVAVDEDVGDNGAVEYQLLPATSPFRLVVSADAAELTVTLVEPLDRETEYVKSLSI